MGFGFISYARADRDYVARLAVDMRAEGIPVWYDEAVEPADEWDKRIRAQIESCSVFVLVMTPEADASRWVRREFYYAERLGKPIAPILLAGAPLWWVGEIQYEDATGRVRPSARFVESLRRAAASRNETPALRSVLARHREPVHAVGFSPDGKQLASGSADTTAVIWNARTGQPRHELTGHPGPVFACSYTSDGAYLATACTDGEVRVWRSQTGEILHVLRHDSPRVAIAFSDDGKQLAAACKGSSVRIWDIATSVLEATFAGLAPVTALAFAPNGLRLAIGAEDGSLGLVDLRRNRAQIDWATLRRVRGSSRVSIPRGGSPVTSLDFVDGEADLAFADGDVVRLWNPLSQTFRGEYPGHSGGVQQLACADGSYLAVLAGCSDVHLWHGRSFERAGYVRSPTYAINAMDLPSDGSVLAVGGDDGAVRIWELGAPTPTS